MGNNATLWYFKVRCDLSIKYFIGGARQVLVQEAIFMECVGKGATALVK